MFAMRGFHAVALLVLACALTPSSSQHFRALEDLGLSNVTNVDADASATWGEARTNTCYEESLYGGCSDWYCQRTVCGVFTFCCDSEDKLGEWDERCVLAAESLCKPAIEELSKVGDACPLGMTCDSERKANCTDLVSQYKDVLHIGNIFGGIYCGEEEERTGVTNCPVGSYCPDPETMLPCPAGYFCPHKTQTPAIICYKCPEGSLTLARDFYGWVLLTIIAVFVLLYIAWGLLTRYNKSIAFHVNELEKRLVTKMANRKANKDAEQAKHKRDIEKLKPKLEVINYRLAKLEPADDSIHDGKQNSNASIVTSIRINNDEILFDATTLFDVLDKDASGDLTYQELNAILGLTHAELKEFIRRMNEMADLSSAKTSVTRPVFAKYFVEVLTETSNLTISYDEAVAMYNELAGNNSKEINMVKFYSSSMSDFLSDTQILEVIKAFKAAKMLGDHDESEASDIVSSSRNLGSARTSSMTRLLSNRRASFHHARLDAISTMRLPTAPTLPSGSKAMMIGRGLFVQMYPQILMDVMLFEDDAIEEEDSFHSVDLCFKDLSLTVSVGKKNVNVVNNVSGRLRGKTMTALMGGSGAGKTSLLNALCGRAHYGETSGTVYINGNETNIEKHADCIGFVPQDDIVHAELTVRENLIFAGKFRLPKGTSSEEIEDLADETIASLGLARVANSLVGDVKRRGVSGGEKKRVNIGLELMGIPSILFLDEPTSGLDASSALLVMKSLNNLVQKDGVTIVSVIHQPRKFIFDLFDSLILLGVGGQMMYHGTTQGAEPYFDRLNYKLPKGESVADWLIDISSGRLEPDNKVSVNKVESLNLLEEKASHDNASHENNGIETVAEEEPVAHVITDDNAVGKKGVTAGKVVRAIEDAKLRRAWLCAEWLDYFEKLGDKERALYEPPPKYDLPENTIKPTFMNQFVFQVKRELFIAWRNRLQKIITCAMIVGSVVFITALDGITVPTIDSNPQLAFYTMVRPQLSDLDDMFLELFSYGRLPLQYPMKVGIMICIIVGSAATTTVTSKRLEFFREAGSGYDLNAYFFAINILSTIEYSSEIVVAALFASWIRHPIASVASYYIHFLLLAWLTVSWSMFLPMIIAPDTVALIAGFYFTFFGLVFSGAFPPLDYKQIYANTVTELLAGWLSPTRYFFEALAVGEIRCLPEQSGYTLETTSYARTATQTKTIIAGLAGRDFNAVRHSCDGWYWSIIPVICIGLTIRYLAIGAMHACFRAQQAKKPLSYDMKRNKSVLVTTIVYCLGFIGLFSITTWTIIRNVPFEENVSRTQLQMFDQYGFFD